MKKMKQHGVYGEQIEVEANIGRLLKVKKTYSELIFWLKFKEKLLTLFP